MVYPRTLIDLTTDHDTPDFHLLGRLRHGGIHVLQAEFAPNPGRLTSANRFLMAVHESEPMEFAWHRHGDRDMQRVVMQAGAVYINPPHRYLYQQWSGRPRVLGIALDDAILSAVGASFGNRHVSDLMTVVGARDPEIENAARILGSEIADPNGPARLLTEGLALTLAVHVFRTYSDVPEWRPVRKGALGSARLRLVIDFIESHLSDDLSVFQLAEIAGLSPSHFGAAFKRAIGLSPYRYVIKRRLRRSESLLASGDQLITAIAYELGFSSHSHFTGHFQRHMGVSPSRYRQDRR